MYGIRSEEASTTNYFHWSKSLGTQETTITISRPLNHSTYYLPYKYPSIPNPLTHSATHTSPHTIHIPLLHIITSSHLHIFMHIYKSPFAFRLCNGRFPLFTSSRRIQSRSQPATTWCTRSLSATKGKSLFRPYRQSFWRWPAKRWRPAKDCCDEEWCYPPFCPHHNRKQNL